MASPRSPGGACLLLLLLLLTAAACEPVHHRRLRARSRDDTSLVAFWNSSTPAISYSQEEIVTPTRSDLPLTSSSSSSTPPTPSTSVSEGSPSLGRPGSFPSFDLRPSGEQASSSSSAPSASSTSISEGSPSLGRPGFLPPPGLRPSGEQASTTASSSADESPSLASAAFSIPSFNPPPPPPPPQRPTGFVSLSQGSNRPLQRPTGFVGLSLGSNSPPPQRPTGFVSLYPGSKPPPAPIGTAPITLAPPTVPRPSYGTGLSSILQPNGTRNGTCGGCTVNVRRANLDWWYPQTYDYYPSRASDFYDNTSSVFGYTMVANPTSFNVTSALMSSTWAETTTYNTYFNRSMLGFVDVTTPMPTAAATEVVTVSMVNDVPQTGDWGDLMASLYRDPSPATIDVPVPTGRDIVATSATPFVYYSNYEVVSKSKFTGHDGHVTCASATQTYNLSYPFVHDALDGKIDPYAVRTSFDGSPVVTGAIPDYFERAIAPQAASCEFGTFEAVPTVIVVVGVSYDAFAPFIVHVESSEPGIDLPDPTGGSTEPDDGGDTHRAHVESSGADVTPTSGAGPGGQIPEVAHAESTDAGGLVVPVIPTPTPPPSSSGDNPDGSNYGGDTSIDLGRLISEIINVGSSAGAGQPSAAANPPSQPGNNNPSQPGNNNPSQPGNDSPSQPDNNPSQPGNNNPSQSDNNNPSQPGNNNTPSQPGSNNTPSQPGDNNTPSQPGNDNSPSQPGSNSPPSEPGNNNPSQPDSNNPSQPVSNNPSQPGSNNPSQPGSNNPSQPGSSNPSQPGNDNSPSSPGNVPVDVSRLVSAIGGAATAASGQNNGGSPTDGSGERVELPGVPGSSSGTQGSTGSQAGDVGGPENAGTPGSLGSPGGGAQPPPLLTIGGDTFTANAATQFFIEPGQTLTPGGAVTVDGTSVSLGAGASFVVVDGSTQNLAPVVTPAPAINVGGIRFDQGEGSAYVVDGSTLAPGETIVVDGNTLALDNGGSVVAINGVTQTLVGNPSAPAVTPAPAINVGGIRFDQGEGSAYVIDGSTLAPGETIVVDGNTLALDDGGSLVAINGETQTLVENPLITPPPILTFGDNTFSAATQSGLAYVISGQTLTPGGEITVDGTPISLAPSATALVVDGTTQSLTPGSPVFLPPVLTIGTETITAQPGTGTTYVYADRTLTPGGIITVSGTTISLSPAGTALIIDGVTQTLAPGSAVPVVTNPPFITVDGTTYTANAGTTYTIGDQTLTPGGIIIVEGTTISLSPAATVLVVDGSSTTLFPATTTTDGDSPRRTTSSSGLITATLTTALEGNPTDTGGLAPTSSGAAAYGRGIGVEMGLAAALMGAILGMA